MMGLSQTSTFDESSLSNHTEACIRRQGGELGLVAFEQWGRSRLWISLVSASISGPPHSLEGHPT